MTENNKQSAKVFIGGLSWETTGEKLRAYFENFGAVREAFVSYNRNNGRPRGFGFVVFESPEVADKVVATKHMIDRREVEAKKAVPKEETADAEKGPQGPGAQGQRTKKIFVGGLAPSVDEEQLRQHFAQFGTVEDAVVMYDHENKRPRGFGFISFTDEEAVERVFSHGAVQTIADKPIEIKAAVPRDQMPPNPRMHGSYYGSAPQHHHRGGYGGPGPRGGQGYGPQGPYGGYQPGPYGAHGRGPGPFNGGRQGYGGAYSGAPRASGAAMGPAASRQQPMPPPHQQGPNAAGAFAPSYGAQPNSMQRYSGPPGAAAAAAAGQVGPNSSPGKVAPMAGVPSAYDMYSHLPGAAGVNNAMLSSLYNLTGLQLPNGLQGAGSAVNPKQLNQLNNQLKALNLAAGFPFPTQTDAYQEDATAYAGAEDFAVSAEAMQNLNNHLSVAPGDFNALHDAGFSAAPAPGWSS